MRTEEVVIPLRRAWTVPRPKRANRALTEVRRFVNRHMKVREDEAVWIDPEVNEAIWARGITKPPRRIRVRMTRYDEEDIPVSVELVED